MFWILFVCGFLITSCRCATVEIYPDVEEIVLPANSRLTLTCRSLEDVTWIHQDFTTEDNLQPSYDIYRDGEYYVSNLTIAHLSYKHVGSYKCQSTTHTASIYIFVKDKDHLIVDQDGGLNIIVATENSDVVIPCKPTEPDVVVKLTRVDNDEELTPPKIPYNASTGYVLKNVQILTDTADYWCSVPDHPELGPLIFSLVVSTKIKLPKPFISTKNALHVVAGGSLNLECSIDIPRSALINHFTWDWPGKKKDQNDSRVHTSDQWNTTGLDDNRNHMSTEITIHNVTHADAGEYVCVLKDKEQTITSSKVIRIFDVNDTYLDLALEGNSTEVILPRGLDKVQWIVNWAGFPKPELAWYSPKGIEIPVGKSEMNKYEVEIDFEKIKLVVSKLTLNDTGKYKLRASNKAHDKTLTVSLKVEGEPVVSIKLDSADGTFFSAGKVYDIECVAYSYPPPVVRWWFKKCVEFPKCEPDFKEISTKLYSELTLGKEESNEVTSTLKFLANDTGLLMCRACNNETFTKKYICDNDTREFLVSDVLNGFKISGPAEIVEGDDVKLTCGANKYHFESDVNIVYQETENLRRYFSDSDGVQVRKHSTKYSHQVDVTFSQVNLNRSGHYVCQARRIPYDGSEGGLENDSYDMVVRELMAPVFDTRNNINGTLKEKTGRKVTFRCLSSGSPRPVTTWYKDGELVNLTENVARIKYLEHHQILEIEALAFEDEGEYTCVASNRVNNVKASVKFALLDRPEEHEHTFIIGLLAVLGLLFIVCAIAICNIRSKAADLKKRLKAVGLANFAEGQVECLNPDLGVDEQADLLPYDKKWEFPRNKLKLGKQLGSGAFGIVMKAEADGILEPRETTTVAVKMVKKSDVDLKYLKALSSEMKIMAHLGKHLNIVNLLGACTGNLVKKELLVIVEYCKYGNLHNYLLKHRDVFINQIDADGNLDPTIKTIKSRYVNLPRIHAPSHSISTTANSYMSSNTMSTMLHSDSKPDQMIGSDGYLVPVEKDPEWRSNITGDYKASSVEPITTQDLLYWAFQVAKGMEYLASRKVMHGDLAARNILLADDKIVKICDFGLAKSMYRSENYQKTGDEPLPIKWMAIESIRDRVFSTQSDVWAYGIVLWELFTLAKTPYPEFDGVENLYLKLASGYRMQKPEYATEEIYDVMVDCWNAKPVLRPSFTELADKVGEMIDDNDKKHVLNLNEVYLRINDENFHRGQDYLAMMGSPNIENTSTEHNGGPHYVNVSSSPVTDLDENGYLRMRRDSSSPVDDPSMELKPMLPTLDINGSKTSSFSNPSYLELSNNHSPEPSYVNTRGGMKCVDDYKSNSRQDMNRNAKLNWLFPADFKASTTLV